MGIGGDRTRPFQGGDFTPKISSKMRYFLAIFGQCTDVLLDLGTSNITFKAINSEFSTTLSTPGVSNGPQWPVPISTIRVLTPQKRRFYP